MWWIDEAPKDIGNEALNDFVVFSYKSHTISDLFSTFILGKERKNRSRIYGKIKKGNDLDSSFMVKIYF